MATYIPPTFTLITETKIVREFKIHDFTGTPGPAPGPSAGQIWPRK